MASMEVSSDSHPNGGILRNSFFLDSSSVCLAFQVRVTSRDFVEIRHDSSYAKLHLGRPDMPRSRETAASPSRFPPSESAGGEASQPNTKMHLQNIPNWLWSFLLSDTGSARGACAPPGATLWTSWSPRHAFQNRRKGPQGRSRSGRIQLKCFY